MLVVQASCGGLLARGGSYDSARVERTTGFESGFNLFSPEQDIELGRASARDIDEQVVLVEDELVASYVQRLGERLAANAPGYGYPYRFSVVSTREINAYALPGGVVYVNAGAIVAARNEGELAGVLAHEISHVALRHGTDQASKAYLAKTGLGVLGAVSVGSGLSRFVNQIGAKSVDALFHNLGRSSEAQADLEGARLMLAAGYDPLDMARFYEKLSLWSGRRPHDDATTGHHPHPAERIEAVKRFAGGVSRSTATSRDSEEFRRVKARLLAHAMGASDGVDAAASR